MNASSGQSSDTASLTGVEFTRLQPGGAAGPNGEVQRDVPGGAIWEYLWRIGELDDDFRMAVPDMRLPANQFWPMHWHDEWIVVLVLDGSCMIGDWWMHRGDILISRENYEYGPVVLGSRGCQLLEVFAKDSWGGGYSEEFHDHPTLVYNLENRVVFGTLDELPPMDKGFQFIPRPTGSEGNAGNQTRPLEHADGLTVGHLKGRQCWDIGEADDPDRGLMISTQLRHLQRIPSHRREDARWLLIMDGSMTVGSRSMERDEIIVAKRGAVLPPIEPGPDGVHFVEFIRSAAGAAVVVDEVDRDDPAFSHFSDTLTEVTFAAL